MTKTKATLPETEISQHENIRSFYKVQAGIYDLTRWAFLFGRNEILRDLATVSKPKMILEIGCGTGRNIRKLGKIFPEAQITGLDVSPEMISKAKKSVNAKGLKADILLMPYKKGETMFHHKPDVILFSYSLTMMNPQWSELLEQAKDDLQPGGHICVVDFHDTKSKLLRRHMTNSHVRIDGHLLPALKNLFEPVQSKVRRAYAGLWTYFIFIGRKK